MNTDTVLDEKLKAKDYNLSSEELLELALKIKYLLQILHIAVFSKKIEKLFPLLRDLGFMQLTLEQVLTKLSVYNRVSVPTKEKKGLD